MDKLYSFFWPTDVATHIAYLIYYAATLCSLLLVWKQYIRKAYKTHWFDVSRDGWLEKLRWDPDIKYLMTNDPLDHQSKVRAGWSFQIFRDGAVLCLSSFVWIAGIRVLHILVKEPSKDHIEIATFLLGFLSLTGAATKVVYEWRLKARAENRQKWIDQIRETFRLLIENMPLIEDVDPVSSQKKAAYLAEHGKLELLMNPSERDHRALMALIRHIYGYPNVPIDEVPRKELDIAKLDPAKRADFAKLKSQMIRLSNVVLKREWERVKHVQ